MHFNTSLARDILRTEHLGDDDDDTKHLKGHTYTQQVSLLTLQHGDCLLFIKQE